MGILAYDERYFEEIEEGESKSLDAVRTITEADVANFAGLSGDVNPIHMSETHAREESAFERRVAHGNLVFVIASSYARGINPHAFSYGYDRLRFVNPVFVGDTISVRSTVAELEDYDEEFGRMVEEIEVENDDGETVLAARHVLLVERGDAGPE